jgi:hypothetical protein
LFGGDEMTVGAGAGLTAGGVTGELFGGDEMTVGAGAGLVKGEEIGLGIGEAGEVAGGSTTGELGPGLNVGAIGGAGICGAKGEMLGGIGSTGVLFGRTAKTTMISFCPCLHRSSVPLTK